MGDEPSEEKIQLWEDTFKMFDMNANGFIEQAELRKAMQLCGCNPSEKDIQEMMDTADVLNPDGKIEWKEFLHLMKNKNKSPEEETAELTEAFKKFDRNGDGTISRDELLKVMGASTGEELAEGDVDDMMTVADTNEDGKLDYGEFVKAMVCH